MFDSYKNILANKFMRDTNYIIIKDTDDIEELERQWELFKSCLTNRQQRLSDDRSIEIWNMTNQQHYEALKAELMPEQEPDIDDEEDKTIFDDDENINDDDVSYMDFDDFNLDDENEITEPVKEESEIPVSKDPVKPTAIPEKKTTPFFIKDRDVAKDNQADQYQIDSNINIIGTVTGDSVSKYLDNLEKAFADFNSQNQDHRKKSDDMCRQIYGMSNIDRYKKLKGEALALKSMNTTTSTVKPEEDKLVDNGTKVIDGFVTEVYNEMQAINEEESNKAKQHRRLNDTPYFTPSEMIDMGVHGNDNYYCPVADNDGLITNVKIPTWFDSYKDMCMDHIFEDYTKEWIDTLDYLYSDFEQIKESGDQDKILARKQSILDLGWNPEIPFTRRNRQLAAKRVSKLLDKSSPLNIFVKLDKEVPDSDITDTPVAENATKDTHKPIYMVFVQGKSPIISSAIKKVTHSPYSHSGLSFESSLNFIHSYNMHPQAGIVKETLEGYKDNIITVMAFFAPSEIYNSMKDYVNDFWLHSKNTVYDFGILFNKLINRNARVVKNKYNQVCSTFVDAVLKSGNVVIDAASNIPSPAELYNSAKKMPNKIIEVFTGPANEYNGDKVEKKMNKILEKGNSKAINEAVADLESAESNDIYHNIDLWESGKSNLLWVTGLSGSGKSTIATDVVNTYGAEHVELDNLQRAKMDNWDHTGSKLMDDYIESKGGLKNIFTYVNDLEEVEWKDIVKNEADCPKQFNDFFLYIIDYAKKNPNRRFVVEGVQLAMCAKDSTIKIVSNYPVIIKMNGPLKTELRRELRTFKHGKETGDPLPKILKKIANRHKCWWQGKFYLDDWKEVNYFRTHIGESVQPFTEVINDIRNGVNPFSTKTFYHISFDDKLDDEVLKPRIPSWIEREIKKNPDFIKELERLKDENSVSGFGYEEYKTPRVCFSNSIEGCLNAVINEHGRMNLAGKQIHVYIPEKPIDQYKHKTNKQILKDGDIFDANMTNEMWILEPVKLKYVGSIVVDKITNEHIKNYANNKHKKQIKYDYKWHWFRKIKYRYDEKKNKFVSESTSLLNEVKAFPIEFDKEGNLIIYKCKMGSISYGDEIDNSAKLLEAYRNENNIEGIKYELAKIWFINDSIEKKLKRRLTNDQYKELIDNRATCLNIFKLNLEYVMKAEKGFNFSDYYNSTPFSDNSIRITSDTLKYSMKALSAI